MTRMTLTGALRPRDDTSEVHPCKPPLIASILQKKGINKNGLHLCQPNSLLTTLNVNTSLQAMHPEQVRLKAIWTTEFEQMESLIQSAPGTDDRLKMSTLLFCEQEGGARGGMGVGQRGMGVGQEEAWGWGKEVWGGARGGMGVGQRGGMGVGQRGMGVGQEEAWGWGKEEAWGWAKRYGGGARGGMGVGQRGMGVGQGGMGVGQGCMGTR